MSGASGSGIACNDVVGVRKAYGKIRWLDMLGHRIFPRHFWGIWERRFADFLERLIRY